MLVLSTIELANAKSLAEARANAEKAYGMPDEMKKKWTDLTDRQRWLTQREREYAPEITPFTTLNAGIAAYLLDRLLVAEARLQEVIASGKHLAEAYMWMALLRQKQNNLDESRGYFEKAVAKEPIMADNFNLILRMPAL